MRVRGKLYLLYIVNFAYFFLKTEFKRFLLDLKALYKIHQLLKAIIHIICLFNCFHILNKE